MKLTGDQFRIRNTTIEQLRPEIEAFGREMARRAKERVTFSLAYQFSHALDAATLQHFQDRPMEVPSLDQLWADFQSRSVPADPSLEPLDDHSVRFSLFLVNSDVLGELRMQQIGLRKHWMNRDGVERYGRMLPNEADPMEERRRKNDWSQATYGVSLTAFDGIVERPSVAEVHAQLPTLQSRAISIAGNVFQNMMRRRFMGADPTPEQSTSALIKTNEYLDTPEGEADFKDVRTKIEGILLPEITIEMLEHGIHQNPGMRLS